MHLTGVISVLPTPFRAGGDVDLPSLARLVDHAVNAGVGSVAVLGPTGEAARLAERERLSVVERVIDQAAGRVPVLVDTSSDGVRPCLEFSRQAKALGAGAAIISPPRAPRLSGESLVNYYRSIAEALDLPIVIQDTAPPSSPPIDAGLLVRIAREVPAARTIGVEDPPTPVKVARILAVAAQTRVDVLGGQGGLFLIEDLMAGAVGVTSAFAYPEALVSIVSLVDAGDVERAMDVFERYLPLLRFESLEGVGAAVRKEVLRRRGVLADASSRAPGFVLDESTRQAVGRVVARIGAA